MKTDTVKSEEDTLREIDELFPIDSEYADFVVPAVNACKDINPDNPLNAAKYITAMFRRLKEISEKTDKWDTTKNILDHITK